MKQTARLSFILIVCMAVAGCSGVKRAFDAANSLDETAYVIAELYSVTLSEAAELAVDPAVPPAVVDRMREVRNRTTPLVLQLRAMSEAYVSVRTADNAEALQQAIDRAALAVAEFLDVVRSVR